MKRELRLQGGLAVALAQAIAVAHLRMSIPDAVPQMEPVEPPLPVLVAGSVGKGDLVARIYDREQLVSLLVRTAQNLIVQVTPEQLVEPAGLASLFGLDAAAPASAAEAGQVAS